ncbi:MAG: AI-2E family transporter [Alphaproteobacteria bacterium]|nr:AI-2E family transporter [Alphaproteobacteria bacterium]
MRAQTALTIRTAVIWVSVVSAAFLLWELRSALAIAFAAVLVAILLRVIMRLLCRIPFLGEAMGLTLAVILIVATVALSAVVFGASAAGQLQLVAQRIGSGVATVEQYLRDQHMGALVDTLRRRGSDMAAALSAGVPELVLSALEGGIVLFVSALYFSASPDTYRVGAAQLFGPKLFDKASEGLELIGTSLRLWLMAQMIVMAVVAIATSIALWLVGVPGALALGAVAGLAEFVPYFGPFVAAVPALFAALTVGLDTMWLAAGVYLGIHLLEGYVLAPLLERYFLRIPPSLVLIGILMSGMVLGPMGFVIAAPLTVALFTAVKVFYVRDALKTDTEIPDSSPI